MAVKKAITHYAVQIAAHAREICLRQVWGPGVYFINSTGQLSDSKLLTNAEDQNIDHKFSKRKSLTAPVAIGSSYR